MNNYVSNKHILSIYICFILLPTDLPLIIYSHNVFDVVLEEK